MNQRPKPASGKKKEEKEKHRAVDGDGEEEVGDIMLSRRVTPQLLSSMRSSLELSFYSGRRKKKKNQGGTMSVEEEEEEEEAFEGLLVGSMSSWDISTAALSPSPSRRR